MESTPDERRSYIFRELESRGRLSTSELAVRFGLSEHTARRDFRELASEGLIKRVHGAALPISPAGESFHTRHRVSHDSKVRLARLASTLILPKQVLLVDGGTTNVEIVKSIPIDQHATIVSNNIAIAEACRNHKNLEVIILGGHLDRHSQMTLGARVLEQIQNINADLCFLGVHGFDEERGLTTGGYDEAAIKTAMMAASAEIVAVVTPDKLGTVAPYAFAEITAVDTIVTEEHARGHPSFQTVLDKLVTAP